MKFAEKIRIYREKTKITQEELAKKLGVTFQTINRLEGGKNKPSNRIVNKFEELCQNEKIVLKNSNDVGLVLINAKKLKTIYDEHKKEIETGFPELCERLILDSNGVDIIRRNFPKGDMIYSDGVDGYLNAISNNEYVPNGESIWELGTVKNNPDSKVKSDLIKRNNDYNSSYKKTLTFVCFSFNHISDSKKRELINTYEKDGWKKVIIYDSVDLETWLSKCPSASLWLLGLYNETPLKIKPFNEEYDDLLNLTSPKSCNNLYLINRRNDSKRLIDYINTNKNIIKIVGPSRRETYGFTLTSLKENNDERMIEKAIVVKDIETLEYVDKTIEDHIIIVNFKIEKEFKYNSNIHILICDRDIINANQYDIRLAERSFQSINDVLKNEMHVGTKTINEIEKKANSNFLLILREIKDDRNDILVKWEGQNINNLIPILLLGKLDTENKIDKELLNLYSITDATSYCNSLREWDKVDGSPLNIYHNYIKVNSRAELWSLLKDNISKETIDKICDKLKEILYSGNEKYELDQNERYMASLYGKNWAYMNYQIENMFDCITLYSMYSNNQTYADEFIKQLLGGINNSKVIHTASDYFSSIVECSPKEFVNYIYKESKKDDSLIYSLFEDSEISNTLFSSSNCYLLIQSLEKALYINEVAQKALESLIEISTRSFKYNYSNNPKNTVSNILNYLNCNTCLDLNDKKNYIEKYSRKYNEKFIDILMNLIKTNSCFLCEYSYKWRPDNRVTDNHNYTYKDIGDYLHTVILEILRCMSFDNSNENDLIVLDLIDVLMNSLVSQESKLAILDKIKNTYSISSNVKIYKKLKTSYNRIKNNSIVPDNLDVYKDVLETIKPNNKLDEYSIYLSCERHDFDLFDIERDNYLEAENKMKEKQLEYFKKAIDEYDVENVIKAIVTNLEDDYNMLDYLCEYDFSKEELFKVLDILYDANKLNIFSNVLSSNIDFGIKYLKTKSESELNKILKYISCKSIDIKNSGLLKTEEQYKIYYENSILLDFIDTVEVKNFIKYNPMMYLEAVAYRLEYERWNVDEILDVLLSIDENDIKTSGDTYHIRKILINLDNNLYNNRKLLFAVARFINIFDSDQIPRCLNDYLFTNQEEYFSIYESLKKEKKDMCNLWYRINSFYKLPNDFYKRESELEKFITSFMSYGETTNDKEYIRYCLGKILARTRTENDGGFLPLEVKDAIEKCDDPDVNSGVAAGYYNSMGVRNIEDGSKEKSKAEYFKKEADEISKRYPNTAEVLNKISDYLNSDSKRDKIYWLEMNNIL